MKKSFPFELDHCKAAAVIFDRAYVNLAQPGPLSDFHRAFTDKIPEKYGDSVREIFRPTTESPSVPQPLSLTQALKKGLLNQDIFNEYANQLDKGIWANTPFRDKDNLELGDINPMAAVQLMLFTGLSTFEHSTRVEKHNALLMNNDATIEQSNAHILIPNYTDMSWEDIVEFRDHPFWKEYQSFLDNCNNTDELNDRINEGFTKIGIRALSADQSIWMRIAAQLPIPFTPLPNPLSLFNEWRSWRAARQNEQEFPWLKVIAHGRKLSDTAR